MEQFENNTAVETTAEVNPEYGVMNNAYSEPVPTTDSCDQPDVKQSNDSNALGFLIGGAMLAVGYIAGKTTEKVKSKLAAKKAETPAPKPKKKFGIRNPFYRYEEPIPEAPAPVAAATEVAQDPNPQQK